MNTSGANAVAGLRNGMYDNRSNVYATAADIGSGTKKEVKNEVNKEEFEDIGLNLVNGLKNGIKDNSYLALKQARKFAQDVVSVTKATYMEKSPSKVFYSIGAFCVEGFENAFKDDTSALRTVSDFAYTVIDAVNENVESFEEINPIISPVLDLDNIQNGSRQISSLLNINPSISSRLSSISSNGKTDQVLDAMNQLTNM